MVIDSPDVLCLVAAWVAGKMQPGLPLWLMTFLGDNTGYRPQKTNRIGVQARILQQQLGRAPRAGYKSCSA